MNDPEHLWNLCSSALRLQVPEATWRACFEQITPRYVDDERFVLSVPNGIVKERLESRHLTLVKDAVAATAGANLEIVVEVVAVDAPEGEKPEDLNGSAHPPAVGPLTSDDSAGSGRTLSPRYTFDQFVMGSSNRFALSAALAVAEAPARSYNPLFIYGPAGLGKTHLLQAIGHYAQDHFPALQVRYVSTETMLNEFVDAIRTNTTNLFKRAYRDQNILLVDDIQFLETSERLQEEFFHTFDHIHQGGGQIVLTSDRHAKALTTLEERLRSRFLMGLITDVRPPDLETRLAILHRKARSEAARAPVPDDVLEMIASHVRTNVRELEGALIRLSAYASLHGEKVNRDLAERVLVDMLSGDEPRQVTPQVIFEATTTFFGVSLDDLKGPSRTRPLVTARQICMYVFRELTDYSYPAIGREFGNRDHTTVMHAVDKISGLMGERQAIFDQVTDLITRIRTGG